MHVKPEKVNFLLLASIIRTYKKIMSRGQGDAEDTIKVDRERLMIRSEREREKRDEIGAHRDAR